MSTANPFKLHKLFNLVLIVAIVGLVGLFFKSNAPVVCANSITCVKNLSVEVDNSQTGVFSGQKVNPPKIDLSAIDVKTRVLGEQAAAGEKHIYVDLAKQTLYAYQGNTLFMETLVSTGKWNKTPTGDFRIWIKLRATRMSGGSGADYYNLPNVPYVMFFSNNVVSQAAGFSLHGAYWHNNFGHTMSHGCVNMRITDAQKLYDWVSPDAKGNTTYSSPEDPGTLVTIYGQSPL